MNAKFQRRIGGSLYEVNFYFKHDAKETMEEKLIRLLQNDLINLSSDDMIMALQTDGLPERGTA